VVEVVAFGTVLALGATLPPSDEGDGFTVVEGEVDIDGEDDGLEVTLGETVVEGEAEGDEVTDGETVLLGDADGLEVFEGEGLPDGVAVIEGLKTGAGATFT
jgi:hypothetical protein